MKKGISKYISEGINNSKNNNGNKNNMNIYIALLYIFSSPLLVCLLKVIFTEEIYNRNKLHLISKYTENCMYWYQISDANGLRSLTRCYYCSSAIELIRFED